jgi:lysosomal alpha-mannosidase
MGSDFTFMNARQNFKNLDKLMKYVNSHPELGIHVEYSTPSKYMKRVAEVSKKENITYPKKTDDFFPYAMEPQGYWTGFFTSRPSLKAVVKESSRYLQKVRTLFGLLEWNNESKFLTEN